VQFANFMALLGLIACDAGVRTDGDRREATSSSHRPHTVSRNKLDLEGLPIPLPKHGLAVQTFGMGDFDLEVIDTDAKTIRVIAEKWDAQKGQLHLDKTLPLGAADVKKLVDLSNRAWREDQHGKMPQLTDVAQHLFIVDGDDAFALQADLIGLPEAIESAVRPNASALVLAVEGLAQAPLTPPLPTAPVHRHAHTIDRATLQPFDTQTPLPLHGLVVHRWDLAGDETIVIDSDLHTLRDVTNTAGKKPSDVTSKHDAKQLTDVMHLAFAAWNEDAAAMQAATDVREDLYVLDGDEAFYVSGHPISAEAGATGRPAASLLMTAVYRVAH
jgi:hypothetical protein